MEKIIPNKKAQGLSLNVVIVAALVLVVLIVLVVILTGRTGKFTEGTKEVDKDYAPGKCEIPGTGRSCEGTCPSGTVSVGDMDCGIGLTCCQ